MARPEPAERDGTVFVEGVPGLADLGARGVELLQRHEEVGVVRALGFEPEPELHRPGELGVFIEPAVEERRPEGPAQPGEASWHELMTTDMPAAMKFYQEVFGWQPSDSMDMGEMGTYQMFNRPHGMIGGMMTKPPQMANVPPNWQIYFRVPDIKSAVERIKANGGQILNGPMEVPGGDWVVNAADAQGAAFGLHAKKAG